MLALLFSVLAVVVVEEIGGDEESRGDDEEPKCTLDDGPGYAGDDREDDEKDDQYRHEAPLGWTTSVDAFGRFELG